METKLKIALQKSGRLYDDSVKILKECGIELQNGMNKLLNEAINFPMQILFLRDDDIPQYVEDGVADIGIVGENVVYETNKNVEIVEKLGFGKCRLSVAVPRNENYTGAQFLNGKRIATTYPFLLQSFLDKNKINAEIHEISGSVEITPGVGLADAICDLVSSGSTLFSNGLKETEVVLNSQAALIGNKNLSSEKQLLLKKLLFRIQAVKKAKKNKYILLNAPNDKLDIICSLIPGMKSPTILPLGIEGWSSLHSVVQEDDFWNIIESLKDNGAEGILIIPIEKMVL
ncbi:ATP phosphoribosyltransferase [Parafilimonas sp.]|uniref:ATP phosphoribosyltransferase n=1 Tax=Parafilimonas sp. TaxID=1969739 RepID=UPI003F7DCD5E